MNIQLWETDQRSTIRKILDEMFSLDAVFSFTTLLINLKYNHPDLIRFAPKIWETMINSKDTFVMSCECGKEYIAEKFSSETLIDTHGNRYYNCANCGEKLYLHKKLVPGRIYYVAEINKRSVRKSISFIKDYHVRFYNEVIDRSIYDLTINDIPKG